MAHTLDLVYGSTTVSLGNYLLAYSPSSLTLDEVLGNPEARLTESLEFGKLPDTLIEGIQRALAQAWSRHTKKRGDRVFLHLQPSGATALQRSEITPASSLTHNEHVLGYEWVGQAFTGFLTLTRKPFWELPRVEVTLDNSSGAPQTGGVTIKNHDDTTAGDDNWVDIDNSYIDGALPTPAEIQLTYTLNDSSRAGIIHAALNVESAPATFTHILEAEAATLVAGSITPSASASGGNYVSTTVGSGAEAEYFSWALSATALDRAKGGRFRVLAKFFQAPSESLRMRLTMEFQSSLIWEQEVQTTLTSVSRFGHVDLGVVRVPPYIVESGHAAIDLTLRYELTGGGTVNLDFLQLTPLDGYRKYTPQAFGLPFNGQLIDNGIEDLFYVEYTGRSAYYVATGQPIMLWPNKDQRLIFLTDKNTLTIPDIAQQFTVRVYYRPRVLTLQT